MGERLGKLRRTRCAAVAPPPPASPKIVAAVFVAAVIVALAGGCTAPRGPLVVTDPDPSIKIPAIKKAAASGDRSAVRQLVAELDSDDPAVRFYAIQALERMTSQRLGYDYYDDEAERKPAVQRWREWLAAREKAPPRR